MESLSKLLSSLSSLAWPVLFAFLIFKFSDPLKKLIESARGRKFTIKVAGNELTMEEASEQQRQIINDVQSKLAELEKRLATSSEVTFLPDFSPTQSSKRILWVDDSPKNNSFIVASLEEKGAKVDIALSTEEGLQKFRAFPYDIVISDMGRPEGEKAGIDFAKKVRSINKAVPFFVYCGKWAARNLRKEALEVGITDITTSSTTLLSLVLSEN